MRSLGNFSIHNTLRVGKKWAKVNMSLRLYKEKKSRFHAPKKDTHANATNKHFNFPIHFLDNIVLNISKYSTLNY